jgi:DNA-directed RNA polymerase subunit RPC12/RpoP
MTNEYEEIEFICYNCKKKVKMLKLKNYSTKGLLCQRCGQNESRPDQD